MKKLILPVLLSVLLASCSGIAEKPQTMKESTETPQVSLGKYEVPNGKEYEFVSFGTGFHFKKPNGELSQSYTSTGEVQKYLNEQNPLITSEYVDVLGKKYRISNYKGTTVADENGKKVEKTFANDQEVRAYLESLVPTCDVTIKTFIPKNDIAYANLNPEYKKQAKDFAWKNEVVSFKTLGTCDGWKLDLMGNETWKVTQAIPGVSGNAYAYNDGVATALLSASQWGYGFEGWYGEWSDQEPPIKTEMVPIKDNQSWLNGKIMVFTFQGGKYSLVMNLWDISFIVGTTGKMKKVSKDEILKIQEDFKLIGKTLRVDSEVSK